jgi:hypothetical protein
MLGHGLVHRRFRHFLALALISSAGALYADSLIPQGRYDSAVRFAKESVHLSLHLFNVPAGRASGPVWLYAKRVQK